MQKPSFYTRRQFTKSALLASSLPFIKSASMFAQDERITARQLVDQIKAHLGIPWNPKTYRDTFKAGNPDTPVLGVASTFMSTFDVIKRAKEKNLNFVISHEPTFWSDADTIAPVEHDPLYRTKLDFVEKNQMVIWRIHDHWHMMRPEPMKTAMDKALGWDTYVIPGTKSYKFPPTTLRALALHVADGLHSRSVRIVGDPDLMVSTLARGSHVLSGNLDALASADAIITSETREWDSVEFIRDLSASGARKGLILIPHEAGEEEGMILFEKWFSEQFPRIRSESVLTTDRLWLA